MSEDQQIHQVIAYLSEMENDLLRQEKKSEAIYQRSSRLIYRVFFILGVFALVNIYFINGLAYEVEVIVDSMVEMYTHFGEMSERMNQISAHVVNIGENVKNMPVIADQMKGMSEDIAVKDEGVSGMQEKMVLIKDKVQGMGGDISDMSQKFHSMNRSVDGMSNNVRDMSNIVL